VGPRSRETRPCPSLRGGGECHSAQEEKPAHQVESTFLLKNVVPVGPEVESKVLERDQHARAQDGIQKIKEGNLEMRRW